MIIDRTRHVILPQHGGSKGSGHFRDSEPEVANGSADRLMPGNHSNRKHTARRPTVLFVGTADWFFLTHRVGLADRLIEMGWDVHLLAPLSGAKVSLSQRNIQVIDWSISKHGVGLGEALAFARFFRVVRKLRPDLIHGISTKPVIYAGLIGRMLRIPVVGSITGLGQALSADRRTWARSIVSLAYRLALSNTGTHLIFQTEANRRYFSSRSWAIPEQSITTPGVGVNLSEFVPTAVPDGTPTFLLPARLLKSKGLDVFCSAVRKLRAEQTEPFIAAIAGRLDPENPLAYSEEEVRALCDEAGVSYLGCREDMPSALAEAAVVVLPTTHPEGVPKVLLEAAASGRAAIATDQPGCRIAVEDGRTGILLEVPTPESLAEAMRAFLRDPDLAQRMGSAARLRAETAFDEARVIDMSLALYARAMHSLGREERPYQSSRPGSRPIRGSAAALQHSGTAKVSWNAVEADGR